MQKRGRKVYFVDGAIRNAALQRGLALLDDPVELGALPLDLLLLVVGAQARRELAGRLGVHDDRSRPGRVRDERR